MKKKLDAHTFNVVMDRLTELFHLTTGESRVQVVHLSTALFNLLLWIRRQGQWDSLRGHIASNVENSWAKVILQHMKELEEHEQRNQGQNQLDPTMGQREGDSGLRSSGDGPGNADA